MDNGQKCSLPPLLISPENGMEICAFLFPRGSAGKESTCNAAMQETWVQSLGKEDPLEYEMATHSSILAWEIPLTEDPGGLQSTGLQRVPLD